MVISEAPNRGRSPLTIRKVTRSNRFGIVLAMAATLGLLMTSIVTANPTGTSARMPSSIAQAVLPSAAAEQGLPIDRPTSSAAPSLITAPTDQPAIAQATPAPAPVIQLVALVPMTVDVWNAEERYFSISGSTPDEIVAAAKASVPADPTGAERHTMAYAGPIAWDHQPSYIQDPATGSCTMTAIASNVRYQATIPQWTSPGSVPPELLAWWQLVLEHIREHESQHIRIFEDYVSALPGRIVGQPCDAWDGIITQWSAEVLAAHATFDAAEARWPFPAYTGPLDW
jgi:predicted secreted Zn-dependent protease